MEGLVVEGRGGEVGGCAFAGKRREMGGGGLMAWCCAIVSADSWGLWEL